MSRRNVAVLMVADKPATSEVIAESIIECVLAIGHRIAGCVYHRVDQSTIRTQLLTWISDPDVDLIVVCGGIEKTSTPRAVAPLVTARLGSLDAGGEIVRSGSTLIVTLTANATAASVLEDALTRLDPPRVAAPRSTPPRPPPIRAPIDTAPTSRDLAPIVTATTSMDPAPMPRAADITTGSIARIGDLPTSVDDGGFVDLRAGKGGLLTLAAFALVAAAGLVLLGINITRRNDAFLTTPSTDTPMAASAPPPPAPPHLGRESPHIDRKPPLNARAPVTSRVSRAAAPATSALRKPTEFHHAPARLLPPSPHLAVEPAPIDDDRCDEATCALHGNERECCTPFRATSLPAKLDRTMVTNAIASVKAKILACGATSAGTGLVKVRVTVDADGRVVAATVEESPEASLGSCVVATIRGATFPRTAAGGSFVDRFEL